MYKVLADSAENPQLHNICASSCKETASKQPAEWSDATKYNKINRQQIGLIGGSQLSHIQTERTAIQTNEQNDRRSKEHTTDPLVCW